MLIGFVGSHGTGKTTTAKVVAALMDGKALLSSSREVNASGLPINKEATRLTQLMITVARSNQAHTYSQRQGLFVADRTPFDSIAYTQYQMDNIWDRDPALDKIYWDYSMELAMNSLSRYEKIFYFPPLPNLEDDGTRLAEKEYQAIIDDRIKSLLYRIGAGEIEIPEGSVLERAHFIQAACQIMV
jgi:ABC-type oligopeptide transport system ATPase subunit